MAEGGVEPTEFTLTVTTDTLRQKLQQMRKDNILTDFVLKVNNINIPCHKVILAASSVYFERLFQHETTKEVSEGYVEFKELDPSAVIKVVEYLYAGTITISFDVVQDVIRVLDHLQTTDEVLTDKLSAYIISNISPENCLSWQLFGDQFHFENVKEKASDIMLQSFTDVIHVEEFMHLEYTQLTDYLNCVLQKFQNHDEILKASSLWVMHDTKTRKDKFEDLVEMIDFAKCSLKVLKNIYKTYGKSLISSFDVLEKFTSAALSLSTDDEVDDILVFGGRLKQKKYNRKMWKLNLETGEYVEKTSLHTDLYATAICPYPEGAVCAGGASEDNIDKVTTTCVQYNKPKDSWDPLPPMPAATCGAGAVCVAGALLMVLGGWEDKKKKAVSLDLKTMTWRTCPDMLQGLVFPIVGCIKANVYVILKTNAANKNERRGSEISLQCYNTETSIWNFKAPLPDGVTSTWGAYAVTIKDLLYVVGGDGMICTSYNPALDTWTILSPTLEPHCDGAALVRNGKIVICGGGKDYSGSDDIEEFDPTTNTWRLLPVKLPAKLNEHGIIMA